jgi:hypothetical protein
MADLQEKEVKGLTAIQMEARIMLARAQVLLTLHHPRKVVGRELHIRSCSLLEAPNRMTGRAQVVGQMAWSQCR